MGWKQERDLLISQTLAFVNSVTARTDAATSGIKRRSAADPAAQATPVDAVEIRAAEIIHAPTAPPREIPAEPPFRHEVLVPRVAAAKDFRSEIQARVASFRAHQQRFEREREQYCSATLTRLRAAIGNPAEPDRPSR